MAIPWQVRCAYVWRDLSTSLSAQLEMHFRSACKRCPVNFSSMDAGLFESSYDDFDVEAMMIGEYQVRRCDNSPVLIRCEYWDEYTWVPYVPSDQRLIGAARSFGRQKTALHIGHATYDVSLIPNQEVQTNRDTQKTRPLRILTLSPVVLANVCQEDEEEDHSAESEDDNVPAEFICPITHMKMKVPVVAADGHSYERDAILKWMQIKTASPVTGATLQSTTLVVNHALRKIMKDGLPEPVAKRLKTAKSTGA